MPSRRPRDPGCRSQPHGVRSKSSRKGPRARCGTPSIPQPAEPPNIGSRISMAASLWVSSSGDRFPSGLELRPSGSRGRASDQRHFRWLLAFWRSHRRALYLLRLLGQVLRPDGRRSRAALRSFLPEPRPGRLPAHASDRSPRPVRDRGPRATPKIREDSRYDSDARVLCLDWRSAQTGKPEAAPLASTRHLMRQYFPTEIERLLGAAGS
jgi:hypothetical protein